MRVSKLAGEVERQRIIRAAADPNRSGWLAGIHGIAGHERPAVKVHGQDKVMLCMPVHDIGDFSWEIISLLGITTRHMDELTAKARHLDGLSKRDERAQAK